MKRQQNLENFTFMLFIKVPMNYVAQSSTK